MENLFLLFYQSVVPLDFISQTVRGANGVQATSSPSQAASSAVPTQSTMTQVPSNVKLVTESSTLQVKYVVRLQITSTMTVVDKPHVSANAT